jgi:hypothetical protein
MQVTVGTSHWQLVTLGPHRFLGLAGCACRQHEPPAAELGTCRLMAECAGRVCATPHSDALSRPKTPSELWKPYLARQEWNRVLCVPYKPSFPPPPPGSQLPLGLWGCGGERPDVPSQNTQDRYEVIGPGRLCEHHQVQTSRWSWQSSPNAATLGQ